MAVAYLVDSYPRLSHLQTRGASNQMPVFSSYHGKGCNTEDCTKRNNNTNNKKEQRRVTKKPRGYCTESSFLHPSNVV